MLNTKIFRSEQEIHSLRIIRRVSNDKNVTDLNKLKEELQKHKIDVKFEIKDGKVQNISFKKSGFDLDSVRGNDRVWTDRVIKSVQENKALSMDKGKEEPKRSRFDEIKANREERTKMQQQGLYNTKGLSL